MSYKVLSSEQGTDYIWNDDEEVQTGSMVTVEPTVEQRVEAIEQAILELAEVVANG